MARTANLPPRSQEPGLYYCSACATRRTASPSAATARSARKRSAPIRWTNRGRRRLAQARAVAAFRLGPRRRRRQPGRSRSRGGVSGHAGEENIRFLPSQRVNSGAKLTRMRRMATLPTRKTSQRNVRLPNALTILRILLVPVFAFAFALPGETARLVAFAGLLHRRRQRLRWTGSPRASCRRARISGGCWIPSRTRSWSPWR
jgi:hypothetical protein